ncbi:MAG: hypothetical protein WBV46_05740 [Terriglobales bacterium]|jgi:hypothetical protein
MKKHTATIIILMLAVLTGLVNAQTGTMVITQVPFNYVANGRTMPAGEVRAKVENNGQLYLSIVSGDQRIFALLQTNESAKPAEASSLVFHKYGNRYFLASVTTRGQKVSYELPVVSLEKELRASSVDEKDVTLVASLKMLGK